ncbi:MAG: hypothetical protein N4A62_07320 [Marinisporobacter sp.]|nr:hypothetical protein [Marinisporobacter sp.]
MDKSIIKKKIVTIICVFGLIMCFSIYKKGSMYIPYYYKGEFFIAEYVFRDVNEGDIIGNPNFSPSFDYVTNETFINEFRNTSKTLGYDFSIEEGSPEENSNFLSAYKINKKYEIHYKEGFIAISFENFNKSEFLKVLRTLIYTIDKEIEHEELEQRLLECENKDFLEYAIYAHGSKIDYRFYKEEIYKVHIEDMKMGH